MHCNQKVMVRIVVIVILLSLTVKSSLAGMLFIALLYDNVIIAIAFQTLSKFGIVPVTVPTA